MPWKPKDASKHTKKANTPAKKHQFAATANAMLEKGASEGSAIRVANAAVKNHPSKKAGPRVETRDKRR